MSSPSAFSRTYCNLTAPTSPIDMYSHIRQTRSGTTSTVDIVIIDSDTEDDVVSSHGSDHNNSYSRSNMNQHTFGNQSLYNSPGVIPPSNVPSPSIGNGGGPIRTRANPVRSNHNRSSPIRSNRLQSSGSSPTWRGLAIVNVTTIQSVQGTNSNLQFSYRHHRQHASAFHPVLYADEITIAPSQHDRLHSHDNATGTSRAFPPIFQTENAIPTTINTNDLQILNTPPTSTSRRDNNISKPSLAGHTKNIEDSYTLICVDCNGILREKLWALSCGHVICGSCVDKFLEKKKEKTACPSCRHKSKSNSIIQLYV
ncbi:sumo-targeted ubiquitin-protein ligase subunit rfp1 [Gigaspora margarita]|uniref:Sumo-targeted ubiquitin-protein ligase subunit rfp1 n=1 Tax=Gigaspora margarita TaxID=4874 RepID=A0A8H3XGI2_GIGMA|nr:sumo-targeted ubiquitin-protein ligase subunit rfp1 [Gigaspora margarita]